MTQGQLKAYPLKFWGMTVQMGSRWHQNLAHDALMLFFCRCTEIAEKVNFLVQVQAVYCVVLPSSLMVFLAVQDTSISDIVCRSVALSQLTIKA